MMLSQYDWTATRSALTFDVAFAFEDTESFTDSDPGNDQLLGKDALGGQPISRQSERIPSKNMTSCSFKNTTGSTEGRPLLA